jgi:YbgC/YbaW family acyl-CoA thioester hydrolase
MEIKNAKIFTFNYQLTERELDVFGHVNNSVYFEIFEKARWDFITANNFGLDRIKKEQRGPVLLEANIKYRRELKNRDRIEIKSQVINVDGRFSTIEQKIFREKEVCSIAHFTVGYFDLKHRKLLEIDQEWLQACGVEL